MPVQKPIGVSLPLTPYSSAIPILAADKLSFERDGYVLFSELDFEVGAGDVLQVSGANGAGKTTLLRILTRSLNPSAGAVLWRGQALRHQAAQYAADMLYIGHQPGIKHALTPLENLRWLSRLQPCRSDVGMVEALSQAGLDTCADVPCYSLSAGQLRRVALARLYLTAATLWILDEPFTAIDKHGIARLQTVLQQHIDGGGAVVLTSHQDVDLAGVRQLRLGE